MTYSSKCNCSKCRRNLPHPAPASVQVIVRGPATEADVPVMTIYQVINLAARYWPVRQAILYRIASVARQLMTRNGLPPTLAVKIAGRQLNIPAHIARTNRGHFTKTRVKAQRGKMARLPRHKDPRLRHTYKGKRFEEMGY